VAADSGHVGASKLGALPNYRSLPRRATALKTSAKANGLPIEAFDRQAAASGCHAVVPASGMESKPQKRPVAPTSMVLSVEPPVGSRL
jgi:hypothetical protein